MSDTNSESQFAAIEDFNDELSEPRISAAELAASGALDDLEFTRFDGQLTGYQLLAG